MATISENLQTIKNSTDAIKQAIIDKGVDVSGDITTWANTISNIQTGSSNGPGSVLKITNKLNGQYFGGPSFWSSITLHSYETNSNDSISAWNLFVIGDTKGLIGTYPPSVLSNYGTKLGYEETYPHLGYSTIGSLHQALTYCGHFNVGISSSRHVNLDALGDSSTNTNDNYLHIGVIVYDVFGNYDIDDFYIQTTIACFLKNTKITLFDHSVKNIQDITYNDELLVWNFDEGKYDIAKPLWIKKEEKTTYYYHCTLDNGLKLDLVGSNGKCHRLFCVEDGMFISATDMVGKTTYTEKGLAKIVSCDRIEKTVEFYNIITKCHLNLFANNVLTSCRYNNIYPIKDMKFIKDDRLSKVPSWKAYEKFRDYRVLDRYINDMRLYEQQDISLEDTINYCTNLELTRKRIDDFDDNKQIINKIEDTEVGWMDRKGNVYGYKSYMPGQQNHITLADKICKELGIQSPNPSRYLEKEGWLKYNTDFVLNSDDLEVAEKQLKTLNKFLKVPNKLKKDGKIRIGGIMSPHIDISEFDNMDKYSFEYRKRHNRR